MNYIKNAIVPSSVKFVLRDIYYIACLCMSVAIGFIWVVKKCSCYKMLNGCFENQPKCESPANENAGHYILSDKNVLCSLMAIWGYLYARNLQEDEGPRLHNQ